MIIELAFITFLLLLLGIAFLIGGRK